MDEAHHPTSIDDHLGGHAAKLEQVDFLTVLFQHAGPWIGQTDEGQFVVLPEGCKSAGVLRAKDDDLRVTFFEFLKVLAQLRHVPLAKGSGKTAIEDQNNVALTFEIGKTDLVAVKIVQCEIGSRGI